MPTISTFRPYTKPNRPTLAADDRFLTDNPATGIGATRWADYLNQMAGLVPFRTERNVALGYAGVAADGLIEPSILRAALAPEEVADDATKDALVIVAGDVGRRLVRVTASGINYLAKATGSGSDKWIVYNSNPAATEAVAGVAEIATDAEADAETDDARIMTAKKTARTVRRIVDPIAATRQPLLGFAYSDGVTSGRRIEWALGALNLAGSPLSEVGHVFRVPSSNPSATMRVVDYASATTDPSLLPHRMTPALLSTAGALAVSASGAMVGSDSRLFAWAGFRAAYSGQWVRLDVVTTPGAANPTVYINGVDVSANFVATSGGSTPPDWMSASLVATYRLVGWGWPAGEFRPGVPINRALSAAEIAQMVQTGSLLPQDRLGGSTAEQLLDASLASGLAGYQVDNPTGGATVNITRNTVDPITGSADAKIEITGAGSTSEYPRLWFALNSVPRPGERWAYKIWYKRVSGTKTAARISHGLGGADPYVQLPNFDGTVQFAEGAFTVGPRTGGAYFMMRIGGDEIGEYRAVASFRRIGAVIQPEITRTAQLLDHGPNRIRGIATSGIRPLSDRDPVGIRGTQAATGYALGLGAADPLWFESGIIRIIRVKPTASAVTNVTFRLNTSGGTVIGTLATSTLNEWVTLPFAAGSAFEVSNGDKLHITTDAALDWDLDWSRR